METQVKNNIKLGTFVLVGLVLMILAFFLIGKNKNLFGNEFKLKVRFANLNGLTQGNNVLFSGLQAGTVKDIELINDTTIEVTMQINNKVKTFINNNAIAAVGTEGLMGNKVINISPVEGSSRKVIEGDMLQAKDMANMDEIIETLSKTNNNVANISEVLKGTVLRIDSSAILKLLNDETIGISLKGSLQNIYKTTRNAHKMTMDLNEIISGIKGGKGTVGYLLNDTVIAGNLTQAVIQIKAAGVNANRVTKDLAAIVDQVNYDLNERENPINTLLKDSITARNLSQTVENLKKGTDGFNQNMEALKHNFLFRGYFKSKERENLRQQKK